MCWYEKPTLKRSRAERLGAFAEADAEALLEAHEGVEIGVPGEAEGAAGGGQRHLRARRGELRRQILESAPRRARCCRMLALLRSGRSWCSACRRRGSGMTCSSGVAPAQRGRAARQGQDARPPARPAPTRLAPVSPAHRQVRARHTRATHCPLPIFQVDCSRTRTLVKRTSRRTGRPLCASVKRSRRVNETTHAGLLRRDGDVGDLDGQVVGGRRGRRAARRAGGPRRTCRGAPPRRGSCPRPPVGSARALARPGSRRRADGSAASATPNRNRSSPAPHRRASRAAPWTTAAPAPARCARRAATARRCPRPRAAGGRRRRRCWSASGSTRPSSGETCTRRRRSMLSTSFFCRSKNSVEVALDAVRGLVDAGVGVDDAGIDAQGVVADVVGAGEQPADAQLARGEQRIGAARVRGAVDELGRVDAQRLHFAQLGVEGEPQRLADPVVARVLAQVLELHDPDDVGRPARSRCGLGTIGAWRRTPARASPPATVEQRQVGAFHLVDTDAGAAGEHGHAPRDVAEQLGDREGAVAVGVGRRRASPRARRR